MDFTNFKFVRIATPVDIEERKQQSLEYLRLRVSDPQPSLESSRFGKKIPGDLVAFLTDILLYPDRPVTDRYKRLGWYTNKGNRLGKVLLDMGLAQEAEVNPGGLGRAFKTFRLTPKGREALEAWKESKEN